MIQEDKNLDVLAQEYIDGVKQYHQEPTWDLLQTAVCYGYHLAEQKPELGEEDDWKRKELIQYLEEKGDYRTVWMTWLKSLRPSWKPSEEQMEALEYVIRDYIEDGCNATVNYLQEILDQIKKL